MLTFTLYYKDKKAAINNSWRVNEKSLHIMALLGGWPGALYAQKKLRHKSIKQSFKMVFYLSIIMNLMWVLMLLSVFQKG